MEPRLKLNKIILEAKIILFHCVSQKNVPPLTCYNLYIHAFAIEPIATVFITDIAEKVDNQMLYFIFPPYLTSASALHGEQETRKLRLFTKMPHAFSPKTRNTVKNIIWSELNHASLSERSTGCTRQDLEGSIASCCVLPTCSVLAKSVTMSVAV